MRKYKKETLCKTKITDLEIFQVRYLLSVYYQIIQPSSFAGRESSSAFFSA